MHKGLRQIPLLKFALPYAAGLQLGNYSEQSMCILAALLAVQLIGCLSGKPTLLALRKLHGMSIYFTVFCTGSLIAQHSQIKTPALDSSDYFLKLVKLKEGKEFWTYEFKLLQDARYKHRLKGGLMAVVKKENALAHSQIGDRFLLRAQLSKIEPAALDHEFDFEEYYLNKGIHYKCFPEQYDLKRVSQSKWNVSGSLHTLSGKFARRIDSTFEGTSIGIVRALLIGDRSKLDSEVKDNFSRSGAIHVLAVSGLHIGVVFSSVFFLFRFFVRKRISLLFALLLVWLYAGLTGLAPPVTRAASMMTAFVSAQFLQRNHDALSSLLLSATFMLILNPAILNSIGAQMSYAAVTSILLAYPVLRRFLNAKDWFMDKVLAMVAVSLAAQILTTPLLLFYFGRIPLHFLLANLCVVPLLVLCFHLGLLWSIIAFWTEVLDTAFSWLIQCYLQFAIELTQAFAGWGRFLLQHQSSAIESLCMFLACFAVLLYSRGIKSMLLPAVLLFSAALYHVKSAENLLAIGVKGKEKVVVLTCGSHALILASSEAHSSAKIEDYFLDPFCSYYNIDQAHRISWEMLNRSWRIGPFETQTNKMLCWPSGSLHFVFDGLELNPELDSKQVSKYPPELMIQRKDNLKCIQLKNLRSSIVMEL